MSTPTPSTPTPNGHQTDWILGVALTVLTGVFVIGAALIQRSGHDDDQATDLEVRVSPTAAAAAAAVTSSAENDDSSSEKQDDQTSTPKPSVTGTQTSAPVETPSNPPSASTAEPQITFNALGGGSTVIDVYASPTDPDSETSTYFDGDTSTALCQTGGRTVSSDPSVGEEARSTGVWIEISTSFGLRRFASLAYADLNVDLGTLDPCTDVH